MFTVIAILPSLILWIETGVEMKKILVNKIQCKCCGCIITSAHRYDLVWCPCGSVAVDGGTDYLKRITSGPAAEYVELSEFEE